MSNGNSYLHFDGVQSYIEIADDPDFSLPTIGELTISAWIRPATLTFPRSENGYVHWLGKGGADKQEWVFRMYSTDNTVGRANRISFYLFNTTGGEGIGSYYQDLNNPVEAGVWLHVVGAADSERTYIYINGSKKDSDVYVPEVRPQHGTAPVRIGTRDFNSYFEGEIREVRFWNRKLQDSEIAALYASDSVPQDGLVAEYVLVQDIAVDSSAQHDGIIHDGIIKGGTWIPQE